jgi:hypothetical protein
MAQPPIGADYENPRRRPIVAVNINGVIADRRHFARKLLGQDVRAAPYYLVTYL